MRVWGVLSLGIDVKNTKDLFRSLIVVAFCSLPLMAFGQEQKESEAEIVSSVAEEVTFEDLPGYKNYQKIRDLMRKEMGTNGATSGLKWAADFSGIVFKVDGKKKFFDFSEKKIGDPKDVELYKPPSSDPPRRRVPRAQQRKSEPSPDGTMVAHYRDFNLYLETKGSKTDSQDSDAESKSRESAKVQLTKEGTERLRFGTCCWVYGEELDQNDAMWWSDDSRRLAYYEVNEEGMQDYHLTVGNTDSYTELLSVRYPKAGDTNPKVALHVYDLDKEETRKLTIDGDATQYLFNVKFLPGTHDLLVSRTNRHQNKLDLLIVNVDSGEVRTVLTETQEAWQENRPTMRLLEDGKRFIWETERTGFKQFELRNLDGKLINPLSNISGKPCSRLVKVDEDAGLVYFTAFTGGLPYNAQLYRVKLDGTEQVCLTPSPLNHTSLEISPDNKWVVGRREQVDIPPSTVVYDSQGQEVAVLNQGSDSVAIGEGLSPPEVFKFKADDGETDLYGTLHFPSNFDPSRKYPLLISVYGGPTSGAFSNRYQAANPICELGFIVAKIGNRGTSNRGKAFETAGYMKLGDIDIRDQADGVKHLRKRQYIDGSRVGIYGHSYGGYMSALAVLRYPDVFHVAVAGAPVTSWKNYDTIYTERYMRTPQENKKGYLIGSCTNYVKDLKGRLLLVHGLIDDNVHPSNTWQLARKLQSAGKRFDMMIYPGFKHGIGSTYGSLRWEYFHKHLRPEASSN